MKIQNSFPQILYIIIYHISLNFTFTLVQPLCHEDERSALSQLKESFTVDKSASSDPLAYPKFETWKVLDQQSDCCSWRGIECDDKTGHVISVELNSSFLFGSFNSTNTLFRLTHLKSLNLRDNHFNYSPIPSRLGSLSKLTNLDLSSTFLTGKIPSQISNLVHLSSLELSDNPLSSQVPNFLANMSSLTRILLRNCELFGEFPKQIFHLPKLQHLSVTQNQKLEGSLPEFLPGNSLKRLVLSNTSFSGNIPFSIENVASLEYLTVARAKFSGSLPSSFGKLHNLTHLDFTSNDFDGSIPSFLQNLTKLGTLWFGTNNLSGQIPSWIGNLTSLKVLSFAGNSLSGPVPETISRLINLRTLNLYGNKLNGTLDFELLIRNMKSLAELRFDENELSVVTKGDYSNSTLVNKFEILGLRSCNLSHFPGFLRSQDRLRYLDLGGNNIRGSIPNWIWKTSLETLVYLALNDNHLTSIGQSESSEFSELFCSLNSLQLLDLSNNKLSGKIPKCLENLNNKSLSVLSIRNNSFHGTIPQFCSNNNQSLLKMIDLSYNNLNGLIPRSLQNCLRLESLNLRNNELVDVFPDWLGNLPNLRLLVLQANNLHGEISNSASKSQFQSLRVIDISHNEFNGTLKSEFFEDLKAMKIVTPSTSYLKLESNFEALDRIWYLKYPFTTTITIKGSQIQYGKIQEILVVIDFSSNRFHGEIPDSIGGLRGLRVVNLSNNILGGEIPSSLGRLSTLESLDLSRNELSLEIPRSLASLTFLSFFDVSYNNLSGQIPSGSQIDTFDNGSFIGNLGLCGYPLSKICRKPKEMEEEEEKEDWEYSVELNWITIVLGVGTGLAIGVVIENCFMAKKRELWMLKACLGWELLEETNEDHENQDHQTSLTL